MPERDSVATQRDEHQADRRRQPDRAGVERRDAGASCQVAPRRRRAACARDACASEIAEHRAATASTTHVAK